MAALTAPPPLASHAAPARPIASASIPRPSTPVRALPVTMQVRPMPTAVVHAAHPYPTPPASLASNLSTSTTASVDGPRVASSCPHFAAAYEQRADLAANSTLATRAAERIFRCEPGAPKRQRVRGHDRWSSDDARRSPRPTARCAARHRRDRRSASTAAACSAPTASTTGSTSGNWVIDLVRRKSWRTLIRCSGGPQVARHVLRNLRRLYHIRTARREWFAESWLASS